MHRPIVSVIIPCFRQGHFLGEAVDSALGQSYPAVEVIVVNDGSDDHTDEVARGYRNRIRYIHQVNQGQAAARNAGIAAATGKYLVFLDADDLLHRDAVGWLVEAAGGREEILCVMGVQYFEGEGVPRGERVPPTGSDLGARLLTSNFAGPPCAVLCPRPKVVACGGFETRLQGTEDWDLWARLVFAGCEVVSVRRVGAYYRLHPSSWTKNSGRMARQFALYHKRVLALVRALPQVVISLGRDPRDLACEVRGQLATALCDVGYHSREEGRYWAALCFYLAGLRWGQVGALAGICKLLPHRLVRMVRPALCS
ncbi:MAG: putative glycosyl transferase, family 2 [Gemmataceae bacterium]|nr:putative glycosyl transferase, family 2 [Gemmataceae bacterium]